jgi:hypothetical protein
MKFMANWLLVMGATPIVLFLNRGGLFVGGELISLQARQVADDVARPLPPIWLWCDGEIFELALNQLSV